MSQKSLREFYIDTLYRLVGRDTWASWVSHMWSGFSWPWPPCALCLWLNITPARLWFPTMCCCHCFSQKVRREILADDSWTLEHVIAGNFSCVSICGWLPACKDCPTVYSTKNDRGMWFVSHVCVRGMPTGLNNNNCGVLHRMHIWYTIRRAQNYSMSGSPFLTSSLSFDPILAG